MMSIEEYHLNERRNEMQFNAVVMSGVVANRGIDTLERIRSGLIHFQMVANSNDWDARILVVSDRAEVLRDSNAQIGQQGGENLVGQTLITPEILSALGGTDVTTLIRDEYVLHVAVSVHDTRNDRVGAVLLIVDVSDIFETVAEIRNTLFLYSLAVGILIVLLVIATSHRLISPVKDIMKIVHKMSIGQLNMRIPITTKDEYSILSKAFNNMSEKLEQQEKTRDEFVSNVSHEMKTPLAAIKVLSESMLSLESATEEMYREFFTDVISEVDRMTNINNDLLALVKVDQKEQALIIVPMSLNELVERILKRLSPLAEKKKVVLLYEQERQVEIEADEIKLTLAISNIVENGIKYTPRGGTVKVNVNGDHHGATITIQDTGIGIPEDEQDKIFNRFYRVDKTRDRDTGGTGLGLSISRSTILLHGGSIRVSSKTDEGSIFTIRIPLQTQ